MNLWLVGALLVVGGGAGTVARYAVGEWVKLRGWADAFPWHTFAVNVVGSFLLGVFAATLRDRKEWYLLLGTGFCGGFTTFSTFSLELVELLAKDRPGAAFGYALGSVLAGVVGAWIGMKMRA